MGIKTSTQKANVVTKTSSVRKRIVFEFSLKTKTFIVNDKIDENNICIFTDLENVEKIYCGGSYLYYFTKNKVYRLQNASFDAELMDKENIIDIVDTPGFPNEWTNILTNDKVFFGNYTINLPKLENNDKFIKLCTGGTRQFAFLLTSRGKIYIYGSNDVVLGYSDLKRKSNKFVNLKQAENIPHKIVDIKCAHSFVVLRCENGDCYASGYNYFKISAESKNKELQTLKEFTLLDELKGNVKQYDCGDGHCLFLTFNGEVYFCGISEGDNFLVEFPLKFYYLFRT
ncbi:hypothetical protein ABK040_004327 [Willaertia magna]